MDSLQTLAIKSLVNNYCHDSRSLLSVKKSIDDFIAIARSKELKNFYVSNDTTNLFSKQLESSTFRMDDCKIRGNNILTIRCDDFEYIVQTTTNNRGYVYCFLTVKFGVDICYSLKFNQLCHSRDPFLVENICNTNGLDPNERLNYGFFLWKYYNKHMYGHFFDESDDSRVEIWRF